MTEFVVKYHKKNVNGKQNRRWNKRKRAGNRMILMRMNLKVLALNLKVPVYTQIPRDVGRRIAFGHSGRRRVCTPAWAFKLQKAADPKKKAGCANKPWVELHKDISAGRDALTCLANASWWSWDQGSTQLFWRWPARHRKAVRDGTKLFVKKELLPHHFKRQLWPSDRGHWSKMMEKIENVRLQGYILPGQVNSLTVFFAVPKGEDNIHIVYDSTACSLNAVLWAPIALSTIDSVLRKADSQTWFSDIDLGKCF